MHELAIAESILKSVQQESTRLNLPPVQKIVLRVGVLSDVVPDALKFNFEIIRQDTPFANTELIIEEVLLEGRCQECKHDFSVENYLFACPECGSGKIDVLRGDELDIAYLEVED